MRRMIHPASSFLLAAALLAGCGDDGDPLVDTGRTDTGADAGTGDAADDTGTSTDTGADTTADAGDDTGTGTDTGLDTGADTDAGADSGADTGTDAVADAGDDTGEFVCGEGVVFTGQAFRSEDEPADSPNGGIPSFTPYEETYDANVAALIAAGVDQEDPVDVDIAVTEATVVATSYNNDTALRAQTNFWVADANGTIEVRLAQDAESQPEFPIIVGQKISFTATQMGWFGDLPQVAAASDFTLVSENNPVYFYEPADGAAIVFADVPGVVRVTGSLVSTDGACGGSSTCYQLDYGADATVTFRTSSMFIAEGDCVTFAGPLTSFNEVPQLNTANFDWLRDYTSNDE